MSFLAKAQKVDLLSLAAEVVLDASPNVGSLDLIKLIQSSDDYEQKLLKISLNSQTPESLATESVKRKIDENDFRQVKTLDKSDPLNVEKNFSQSRCCVFKSCDSSTLENHVFKCGDSHKEEP
ncbi:hypothetical protein AVEN_45344-1 [Araneus ventricosus]|uniref:Uncharacterized protein n=1 Tax=Araneus ventricosus TaxID=182803 RepID=A0A4Y2NXN9_ARAVE|nr:hypothetical protein AVEN_1896-1 [Araneus ventricosus]GBN43552.1 hypothetical protein AVEN_45344-1 [Araneus ventricosus]